MAIPKSLGLRIVRICSNPINRDIRLKELKDQLLERKYNEGMVDRAIEKARKVPRSAALKKVPKNKKSERPVFPVVYDPRLPQVTSILTKHWRSMVSRNKHLEEVFPSPPLTAYKRQPNLRSILVRAALPKGKTRYP